MSETDDDLFAGNTPPDVLFGGIGRGVAVLDLERDLVRAAVLCAAQRADGSGDA